MRDEKMSYIFGMFCALIAGAAIVLCVFRMAGCCESIRVDEHGNRYVPEYKYRADKAEAEKKSQ